MNSRNSEGLSFEEWLRAAGYPYSGIWPTPNYYALKLAEKCWRAGEDPTDHKADRTFAEVKS